MKKIGDERETGMSQIGYCIYCGQGVQLPVEEETDKGTKIEINRVDTNKATRVAER